MNAGAGAGATAVTTPSVRANDLDLRLYGIRHHGPGSARSLRDALAEQRPDVVLIEGPPEADPLLGLAADPEMSRRGNRPARWCAG